MIIDQPTKEETMSKLTKQEELFFDRVALKMAETGETIEQAAKSVLNDDIRILNTYSRMSDEKQREFRGLFCGHVYRAIHAAK
jgi:hypothetical protein